MKIKVFMNSAGSNRERDVLRRMHDGIKEMYEPKDKAKQREWRRVNKALGYRGSGVEYCYEEKYSKCDVAVMFGSWKPERSNIHHIVRSSIVDSGTPFICVETPLLGRTVNKGDHAYYRVGVNGFLNRSAYWGQDSDYPGDRLKAIGVDYKGWRPRKGNKIIVALQLAGDASLRGCDINQWCWDVVHEIQSYTDRPIEIRTHPAMSTKGWGNHDELFRDFLFKGVKNISFVNGAQVPWETQLEDAYCVVTYSSGLAIDAVVAGVPVIAYDEGNFAWNVGETKIKNIERMNLAKGEQVQQWINNLSYCQWNLDEMESGKVWNHLKSTIDELHKLIREESEE